MAKSFSELQTLAIQIRDELNKKKNSAQRVGSALLDIIDNCIQNITDIKQKLSVFEHACSGFKRVSSEAQLPVTPSQEDLAKGFLVNTSLYLYVGTGGNAVNGRYFNVGDIRGPQGEPGSKGETGNTGPTGEKGEQGNSGVTGDTSDIVVINNLDGGESEEGSIKVLAAEQGKVLNKKFTEFDNEKVGNKSISNSLYDKNNNQVLPYNIDRENGIYIQGGGEYEYGATYAITDYFPVIGIANIKWNGYLPIAAVNVAALVFYDYKKDFLSSITVGNTGTYTEEKREIEVVVPSEAVYCRGCTFKNNLFSIEIKEGNLEYLLNKWLQIKNEINITNRSSLQLVENLNPLISSIFKFEVYLTKDELEYNLSIMAIGWTNNKFYIQIAKDGKWYKEATWIFSEIPTGVHNLIYYSDNFIINAILDTSTFGSLNEVCLPIIPFNIESVPYYLNSNIKNLNSIDNKLQELLDYIALPTNVSYKYSPESPATFDFNIHFEANSEIRIQAETDFSISKEIAGNVWFDDGSKVYPTVNVSNGYGTITLKYDKAGSLRNFGFRSSPKETFTVNYTIQIKGKKSIYNNLPYISENDNRIYNSDNNPLKSIKETIGFAAILHSIGYIGDSLMSGELAYIPSDGEAVYKDCYEFSWGQRLSALINGIATNYSRGGLTTRTWINSYINSQGIGHSNDDKSRKFVETKFQAYINGLGTNDTNQSLPIGTIDDIDFEDYNNNADTFYGNYAKILQKAREVSPKCFLFCLTIPTIWQGAAETNGYNDAIRNIAAKLDKCYIIQ